MHTVRSGICQEFRSKLNANFNRYSFTKVSCYVLTYYTIDSKCYVLLIPPTIKIFALLSNLVFKYFEMHKNVYPPIEIKYI